MIYNVQRHSKLLNLSKSDLEVKIFKDHSIPLSSLKRLNKTSLIQLYRDLDLQKLSTLKKLKGRGGMYV
jgi:hypothetical protein